MASDERYLNVDDAPDLPECRVLAGWDVAGGIRFEMPTDYAESLLKQVRSAREQPRDGFVDIVFMLDYPAYVSLTKGLAELHQASKDGDLAVKQVMATPEESEIAVSVLVNASQIKSSLEKNYAALEQYGRGRRYGQRFGISENGAVMLEEQLEAALDGAENPLDHVDADGGDQR